MNGPPEVFAEGPEAQSPGGLGTRHFQVLLIFLGLVTTYMLRAEMSVAIVAMSNSTTANPDFEGFSWDLPTQSIILSSFFWGNAIFQLPLGQLAHIWSASKLWSLGMLISGLLNIFTPFAVRVGGWRAICACRIIMGISQGCVIPCIHNLLGRWAPSNERSRLGTYSYAGYPCGTILGLSISGILAASSTGWPSIFYVIGVISIAWSIAFYIWGADSPALHRGIEPSERNYIEESLGQVGVHKQPPTPWKAILTSIPLWSLIIAHCGHIWGYWMLLTEIPTYMNAVLRFNISENGIVSALPYVAMWLLSFPGSWTSDYVQKRGWVTRATARKVSNSIGHWGPAVALLGLGYITSEHTVWAVIVLVFAVSLNAGSLSGCQINHIDLSPNFAGTLMGISNSFANIMPILAPLIAGVIVVDTSDITQWRTVFFISAGIYFFGNLIFVIFGEAEVQSWNEPEVAPSRESEKMMNREKESDT